MYERRNPWWWNAWTVAFAFAAVLLVGLQGLALAGDATATAPVIPAVETAPAWLDWVAVLAKAVLPVVGVLLVALLSLAVRKIAAYFHVNASFITDQQVQWAVAQGVNAAEAWAATQAFKPTGNTKQDMALQAVNKLLETDVYKQYGESALKNLIDAQVQKLNTAPATDAATTTAPAPQGT